MKAEKGGGKLRDETWQDLQGRIFSRIGWKWRQRKPQAVATVGQRQDGGGEAGGSTSLQEELPGVGDQEGSRCGWSPKGQESLFNFVGNRGNLSSFGHRVDTEWSRTHRVTP